MSIPPATARAAGWRTEMSARICTATLAALVFLAGCDRPPEPAALAPADPHAHHARHAAPVEKPVVEMAQSADSRFLAVEAPAPGSYVLPPIRDAADGAVLLASGEPSTLHEVLSGRYVVLSFVFTRCSDTSGCPLATGTLHRIHRAVRSDPELDGKVRLITLSFDPEHDTPEQMSGYGQIADEGADWLFLTTPSQQALQPILEAYDQHIMKEYDADGNLAGGFSHILRVYLIDDARRIRNIYSSSYLYPELLIADLKTLLRERDHRAAERG
jgi:cytochrome c peroxidase